MPQSCAGTATANRRAPPAWRYVTRLPRDQTADAGEHSAGLSVNWHGRLLPAKPCSPNPRRFFLTSCQAVLCAASKSYRPECADTDVFVTVDIRLCRTDSPLQRPSVKQTKPNHWPLTTATNDLRCPWPPPANPSAGTAALWMDLGVDQQSNLRPPDDWFSALPLRGVWPPRRSSWRNSGKSYDVAAKSSPRKEDDREMRMHFHALLPPAP